MSHRITHDDDHAVVIVHETQLETRILDYVIESFARCLLPHIREFYEDPQNRAEYKSWLKQQESASD